MGLEKATDMVEKLNTFFKQHIVWHGCEKWSYFTKPSWTADKLFKLFLKISSPLIGIYLL